MKEKTLPLIPHHDGSELYLSTSAPTIGESVEFRVRVPSGYRFESALLRIYQDAEPRTFELALSASGLNEEWWSASAVVMNPVAHYRFLFVREGSYQWLNAAGIHSNEVTSTNDFQILARPSFPQWIHQSVFYQIFPDRFASSGKRRSVPKIFVRRAWNDNPRGRDATTGVEYFGGDLEGVESHLDYLSDLGISGIYFTPFFEARSTHRYDASSFEHVDPLLGGDKAMKLLIKSAAQRGIRIMGDLTTNHVGVGHDWFKKAIAKKNSKERGYFYWDTSIEHGYVGWWGLASLPKLNYSSADLRKAMFAGKNSVVRRWLRAPMNMAGWRIDVGNMTGRYLDDDFNREVIRGIRGAMDETNPDAWLVAENADHFPADLDGLGWHGTMNYNGFMRPIWGWLQHQPEVEGGFFGLPTGLPDFSAREMVTAMQEFNAGIPWRSLTASMLLLNSHDTARFRNVVGGDVDRHLAGVGLLLTYPGVPSIFAGDEIGLRGAWGEDARRTINWENQIDWDLDFLTRMKELIALRKKSHALAHGGLRWIAAENNVVVFLRESNSENLLVLISRGSASVKIDLSAYGYSRADSLYGDRARGSKFTIKTDSASVRIWTLS